MKNYDPMESAIDAAFVQPGPEIMNTMMGYKHANKILVGCLMYILMYLVI